jgi:hypothetical protein
MTSFILASSSLVKMGKNFRGGVTGSSTWATGGGGGGGSLGLGGSRRGFPNSSPSVTSGFEDVGASLKNMLAASEGRFFSRSRVVSLKRLK